MEQYSPIGLVGLADKAAIHSYRTRSPNSFRMADEVGQRYAHPMASITIHIAPLHDWWPWLSENKDQLAVLMALIGLPILLVQITQGARQERKRLERRRIAATATLPLTLSSLSQYARSMMRALAVLESWFDNRDRSAMPVFDGPEVPEDAIEAVEQMIEAAPNKRVARQLAAVVSDIQVLSARTNGLRSGDASELLANSMSNRDNIVLAGDIHARAEDLFDYARSYSEQPDPPAHRVQSALNIVGIRDHLYPQVHERLARRLEQERAPQPWHRRLWSAIGDVLASGHRRLWP